MNDDQARSRFFIMNLSRIGGAMLAVVGLASIGGQTQLPQPVGYVLMFAGLFGFLFLPRILANRWRSPPE